MGAHKTAMLSANQFFENGERGVVEWLVTAAGTNTDVCDLRCSDDCMLFYKTTQDYAEGQWYQASTVGGNEHGAGATVAIDPKTGGTKWRFEMISGTSARMLATAGGLAFGADGQGYLIAFDTRTGKVLWKFQTGGGIVAPPISYSVNGRQYVEVAAGQSLIAFAIPK